MARDRNRSVQFASFDAETLDGRKDIVSKILEAEGYLTPSVVLQTNHQATMDVFAKAKELAEEAIVILDHPHQAEEGGKPPMQRRDSQWSKVEVAREYNKLFQCTGYLRCVLSSFAERFAVEDSQKQALKEIIEDEVKMTLEERERDRIKTMQKEYDALERSPGADRDELEAKRAEIECESEDIRQSLQYVLEARETWLRDFNAKARGQIGQRQQGEETFRQVASQWKRTTEQLEVLSWEREQAAHAARQEELQRQQDLAFRREQEELRLKQEQELKQKELEREKQALIDEAIRLEQLRREQLEREELQRRKQEREAHERAEKERLAREQAAAERELIKQERERQFQNPAFINEHTARSRGKFGSNADQSSPSIDQRRREAAAIVIQKIARGRRTRQMLKRQLMQGQDLRFPATDASLTTNKTQPPSRSGQEQQGIQDPDLIRHIASFLTKGSAEFSVTAPDQPFIYYTILVNKDKVKVRSNDQTKLKQQYHPAMEVKDLDTNPAGFKLCLGSNDLEFIADSPEAKVLIVGTIRQFISAKLDTAKPKLLRQRSSSRRFSDRLKSAFRKRGDSFKSSQG